MKATLRNALAGCLLLFLVITTRAEPVQTEDDTTPYVFEDKLTELLENLRNFLKNGSPESGIPPQDPLSLPDFGFDFYLLDMSLRGDIINTVFDHVSEWNTTYLKFSIFPGLTLTWKPNFEVLKVTGRYDFDGYLFGGEIPIAGTGEYVSDVSGLLLDLVVDCSSRNGSIYIRDLTVLFELLLNNVQYTNERDGTGWTSIENIIEIFYRIRDEYFPAMTKTLSLVASDMLVGVTADDIIHLITGGGDMEKWLEIIYKVFPLFIFRKQ